MKKIFTCLFVILVFFLVFELGVHYNKYKEMQSFGYDFGIQEFGNKKVRELPYGLSPYADFISPLSGDFNFRKGDKWTLSPFSEMRWFFPEEKMKRHFYIDAYALFDGQLYVNTVDTSYQYRWVTPIPIEEERGCFEWEETELPADIHDAELYVPIYGNHRIITLAYWSMWTAYYRGLSCLALLAILVVACLLFKGFRYLWKMGKSVRARRYDEKSGK